jgi:hypothetical protein
MRFYSLETEGERPSSLGSIKFFFVSMYPNKLKGSIVMKSAFLFQKFDKAAFQLIQLHGKHFTDVKISKVLLVDQE